MITSARKLGSSFNSRLTWSEGFQLIKIGVIGAGYWGKKIINEYSLLSDKDPNVKLAGICDFRQSVLVGYLEKYESLLLTTDYHKLLSSPNIHAVHVCTPNETHYPICRDALENGVHVLVEKPMTLNSKEAYELVDLAEKKELVLSVGHIFRFNNALLKLRDLIRDGFFGDIRHLRLEWATLIEPPKGRDIISDLAPHPFDIVNFLLDDWPVQLSCVSHPCKSNLAETAYIDCKLNDELTAHIELSWLLPGKTRRVTVIGSDMIADCDCLSQRVSIFEGGTSYELDIEVNNTIGAELRHFIDSINNNNSSNDFEVQNSGVLGAKVVDLLALSNESQKRGDWIQVSSETSFEMPKYAILKDVIIGDRTKVYDQVNLYRCEIGENCKIDAFVYIEEGVRVGDNCKLRAGTFIPTGVTIKDDVFIGPNVTFTNDKYPRSKGDWKLLTTMVKRGASIGANSVILPGITIGENAMVGAGSVVTKDVPDNVVVVGNPARILKRVLMLEI